MKKTLRKGTAILTVFVLAASLAACGGKKEAEEPETTAQEQKETTAAAETTAAETEKAVETFTDKGTDSHALVLKDGDSYKGIKVEKTGDSNKNDEADFTGTNAAVYAGDGVTAEIEDAEISASGKHANAVFAYGDGAYITLTGSEITTDSDFSGGIMVAGGGQIDAHGLKVKTSGDSSAPVRSDRGGGSISIDGGSFESGGKGSPAIYSTADIEAEGASFKANASQAVVIEGKNSVTLVDSSLTSAHTKLNGDQTDRKQAVMIYQSTSGDAEEGESYFTMDGGSITSTEGGMFFVTNTVTTISLGSVEMKYADDDLLTVAAAGWGDEGINGGQVSMYNDNQKLEGKITVDEISNLNLVLDNESEFSGSINGGGEVYVEVVGDSKWILTEDSQIASLTCDEESIDLNGHTLTVGSKKYAEGTVVEGEWIDTKIYEKGDKAEKYKPAPDDGKPLGEKPDMKPIGDGPDKQPR